jgi:hypothetical protein
MILMIAKRLASRVLKRGKGTLRDNPEIFRKGGFLCLN